MRLTERSFGVHCANTNNARRCLRDNNPRLGSLSGANGAIFQNGQRVGRVQFANVVTQRGRRNSGAQLFLATVVLNDGTLTLQGAESGGESAPAIPSSVTGGSGAYAGARGFTSEESDPSSTEREFRLNVTVTFIP